MGRSGEPYWKCLIETFNLCAMCVQWDAFSVPELNNFLVFLHKEEEQRVKEIRRRYKRIRHVFEKRMKEAAATTTTTPPQQQIDNSEKDNTAAAKVVKPTKAAN